MSFDLFVIHVNLAMAVVAAVVNWWALARAVTVYRWIFASIGTLAMLYAGSYVWLALEFPERTEQWSQVMRGVSIVAWGVVWTLPAVLSVRSSRKRRRFLEELNGG